MHYSAKELTEVLNDEGSEMTVRKIRYYSQIGVLSPLEIVNGRRKYTTRHLEELRAIRTMQKTGIKLDEIKGSISKLDTENLSSISEQISYVKKERLLETYVEYIDDDISIIFNKNTPEEKRTKTIETVMNSIKNM